MNRRKSNHATPADMIALWTSTSQMLVEAQTVVALRMLGMAGIWPVAATENTRMVEEKMPALIASGIAAGQAAMAMKRPDEIMAAAVRPLGVKTRSNARRLSRYRKS